MNCLKCGSDSVVTKCSHCGHEWDDARIEALERVIRALWPMWSAAMIMDSRRERQCRQTGVDLSEEDYKLMHEVVKETNADAERRKNE